MFTKAPPVPRDRASSTSATSETQEATALEGEQSLARAERHGHHLSNIAVRSPQAPPSSPVIQLARDKKRQRTRGSSTIVLDPQPQPLTPPVPPPPAFQPFTGTGHVLGGQPGVNNLLAPFPGPASPPVPQFPPQSPKRQRDWSDSEMETGSETESETELEPPSRRANKRPLESESESEWSEDPMDRLQIGHLYSEDSGTETEEELEASPSRGKEEEETPSSSRDKGKAPMSDSEEEEEEEDSGPSDIEARAIQNYMRTTGNLAIRGTLTPQQIQHWAARPPTEAQLHPRARLALKLKQQADEDKQRRSEQSSPQSLNNASGAQSGPPKKKKPAAKPKPKPAYSDDESDEASAAKTREHYVQKILKDVEGGKKYDDASSSESDDAIDSQHPDESRAKRRAIKLAELKALARQTRPLTDEQMAEQKKFQDEREKDYASRTQKRRKYSGSTQDRYQQLAENFDQTSFLHNSLLRRSFRKAIPKAKMEEGGSANYNGSQGKIRDELKKQIAQQMGEFSESDFSDPEDYATLKHMGKYRPSNDKKKRRLHEAVSSGQADDPDASTVTEYHHIGFKESDKRIGEHALNPANLTMLFGERTEKKSTRAHGAHQQAHDLQGFQPPDKSGKTWHGRGGGGVFKNMDAEGTHYITRHVGRNRASKKDLYKVDPEELGYETDDEKQPQQTAPSTASTPSTPPPGNNASPPSPTPPRDRLRQLMAEAVERRLKKQQDDKKQQ
ncbi:hypothetical protein [Archangium lansingense]|uniref:Uncharacterized protein n=1 Tax=Archangium lansingense TaxID=2995310 RepID=A0ABT4AMZ6_9BACT|nr:hypothetical protein [Archangium lansinium]MCY1083055.1 hypothetical protein [Archangium lansinium]